MATMATKQRKGWRASEKTVSVRCPKHKEMKGSAAANAVLETTPMKFRAMCPLCDAENIATPLVVKK